MNAIGRIRQLREFNGITQAELADKVSINRSVMSRIENGTRPARDDELRRIAHCFNVSTDYLLGNDEPARASFSDRQIRLIRDFDRLPPDSQTLVWQMIRALLAGSSARAAL